MDYITDKKKYCSPAMELITLDNDISLAMESTPPDTAPGETPPSSMLIMPNDPFRNQIG